jgi:DNA-directed RNA polymerase subunit RPC12/RpoP
MKGKCKTCSAIFYGWTMTDLAERKCTKCGGTVELVENVPISKLSDVLAMRLRH